ncbi:MAG: 16S rRNA (cytosine(1402)-N(4))-methyltransferase RsmH [Alphaproteobacteria bacterium]|nr:16S rRNA (cytosine(1402)-N(4))-methyltransferase RsmH [Alphaproteobacteria bacterium]
MDLRQRHIPVMLNEVLKYLAPQDGKTYVDATFGNGGYTTAILESADCKVIAIDRDPTVLKRAQEVKDKYGHRFEFVSGCFGNLRNLILESVDGFVFDIGVSSMQLDDADRGFSFSKEAPLDMRMSLSGISAADIVNNAEEKELADILYTYGEEKKSRQIARKIVEYRKTKPIETTTELAEIIYSIIHKNFGQINPATRTFQALRIAVNEELNELKNGLSAATDLLKPNGRLVVVDFHSLEDRIVKKFFNEKSGKTNGVSRYMPQTKNDTDAIFEVISKAVSPSDKECEQNNRARSAKLRYAIKKGVNND